MSKKKKIFIGVLIVLVALIIIIIGIFVFKIRSFQSMGGGNDAVADYDKRILIWNDVAGNSNRSKTNDMNIDYEAKLFSATMKFADKLVGDTYVDAERELDTFSYLYEIKGGYEKETYSDQPYIIPYLAESSDIGVIVIPGGGFGYVSMDGGTSEGKDVAKALNERGISAFVLHYRTNTYEYPIPYLDLQRAVRFLRYHAAEYGLNPDKITMIGGSAGGNLIATYINATMGKNLFPDEYILDTIDQTDDTVSCAAMLYPAVSFNDNIPMLFNLFDADSVRDEKTRKDLLKKMDMTENFNSAEISQFIAYGSKDKMVGTREVQKYIDKAKNKSCDITVVVAEGQPHGFSAKYYIDGYDDWLKRQF